MRRNRELPSDYSILHLIGLEITRSDNPNPIHLVVCWF